MRKRLITLVGIVISVGLIYLIVGRDLTALRDEFSRVNPLPLLPAFALFVFSTVSRGMRWYFLADRQVSLAAALHMTNVGYFINSFIPLRAGDFTRLWLASRERVPVFTTLSALIIERLLDVLMLVVLLALMLLTLDVPPEITAAGLGFGTLALVGMAGLFVLAAFPAPFAALVKTAAARAAFLARFDLERRFAHFVEGLSPLRKPRPAAGALVWSFIGWSCDVGASYVIQLTLFGTPSLPAAFAVVMLAGVAQTLPAMPGNLGPLEAAVVTGLWLAGLVSTLTPPGNAPAVVVGLLLHVLILLSVSLLGAWSLSALRLSVGQVRRGAQAAAEST